MTHIAIIEPDAIVRARLADYAAEVMPGATVSAFALGREALARLAEEPADVIALDWSAPDLEGADFMRRLRALPGGAGASVLALTGHSDHDARDAVIGAGATDFLSSPLDRRAFVNRMRNLLLIASRRLERPQSVDGAEAAPAPKLIRCPDQLAQIVDAMPALISAADLDGVCVFVNARLAAELNAAPEALIGRPMLELFGPEHGARSAALDKLIRNSGAVLPSFEEEIAGRDGRPLHVLTAKAPLRNGDGDIVAVLTTSVDITERKRAEGLLHHLAHHDGLTNLPNRSLLIERLRQEIARSRRTDRKFALHVFDLDRFKAINDVLGHHVGDGLLKAVAERLAGTVRETDMVARLGGDEFAVMQASVDGVDDIRDFARRVREALAEPVRFDGHDLSTSASIGVSIFPDDSHDVDDLLKFADIAMYRAKAEGRDGYRIYAAGMDETVRIITTQEADLRRALELDEFELYYQPQVSLSTGRIVGAEALIRWRRGNGDLVMPSDFLPRAEESGLIIPISNRILREACSQAASWPAQGLLPLRVAINLSGEQFRRTDVERLVLDALARSGLAPERLELEITETTLLRDMAAVAKQLDNLRAKGVRVSIDDFGTGYASLAYVKQIPVDRLKIAKSFIDNLKQGNDAAIVRAVVTLAHSIGMEVIAEGVETAAQVAHLKDEGCDEVQGFYFGRPMRPETFVELVRREMALGPASAETPRGVGLERLEPA